MNIVIPFRNTCGFKEIDMCIKLIKKNYNVKYNLIYVVGDLLPKTYSEVVNIVIEEQKYNKWLDSNFLTGHYIKTVGDPFILFNDDFFITSEVTDLTNYYYGTLKQRSEMTYVVDQKAGKIRPSAYGLNILKFIDQLGDSYNYEVHLPFIVEYPHRMLYAMGVGKQLDCPALKRTLYMHILATEGLEKKVLEVELNNDVKFREPLTIIQYPYFSLTDEEFDVFEQDLISILGTK